MEYEKYLINGLYYDKDEILKDGNLKNELEKQLKKELHREYCKLKRREYAKAHPDEIKLYNKTDKAKEYQKEYQKQYRQINQTKDKAKEYYKEYYKKKVENKATSEEPKKRGRHKKYILDESLKLVMQ